MVQARHAALGHGLRRILLGIYKAGNAARLILVDGRVDGSNRIRL